MSDVIPARTLIIPDGDSYSYEEARAFIKGYVEVVNSEFHKHPCQLIVHEEGLLLGLPLNKFISSMQVAQNRPESQQYIVGNVVVLIGSARWD